MYQSYELSLQNVSQGMGKSNSSENWRNSNHKRSLYEVARRALKRSGNALFSGLYRFLIIKMNLYFISRYGGNPCKLILVRKCIRVLK